MLIRISAVAVTVLQIASFVQAAASDSTTKTASATKAASSGTASTFAIKDYWKNFKSNVNPLNITIANIPQTTSLDPTTECTYYQPPSNFVFNEKEWPNLWETATSNGMANSAEFKAVYNAIDWTKAPNIPVRSMMLMLLLS